MVSANHASSNSAQMSNTELYLSMFSMIGTHPHAAWRSSKWGIQAIHMECQWTEITMHKLANKFTPAKQQQKILIICRKYAIHESS